MVVSRNWLMALSLVSASAWTLSCSDEKKPEEVVQPSGEAAEAKPPGADGGAGGFQARTVYFAFDDYSLNNEARSELDRVADHLSGDKKTVIQIEGHCDERGSDTYNLALGERRAQSAKKYLTNKGVDAARVSTISYGEERPIDSGTGESSWSKNRRDEFNITSN